MSPISAINLWVLSPLYGRIFPRSYVLELDFIRVIMSLHRLETTILDTGDHLHNVFVWGGTCVLRFLWHAMHLILGICYFIHGLINSLESFLIARGLSKRYRGLDISKVKYLAVVIDSEEALQTLKVLDLLRWLAAIGFKNVCLYDAEGVLKKTKDTLALWLKSESMPNGTMSGSPHEQKMHLEVLSLSDGKQAIAKAANTLLKKHRSNAETQKLNLTESDLVDALREQGYKEPDPDLMLIYGPARCHLGFPAWRIRYTEIVHMGSLKSIKFGGLIKALHRFSMVRQNYGK